MRECKAPDCDNEAGRRLAASGYCSNVCWNVGIEAAGKAVELSEPGDVKGMSDLDESLISEIRRRNERGHAAIERKIDAAERDV